MTFYKTTIISFILKVLFFLFFSIKSYADAGALFEYYMNNPNDRPSEDVIAFMQEHHIILVAGYMNEYFDLRHSIKGLADGYKYLGHNQKVLEGLGIKTTVHNPLSIESVEYSADKLFKKLLDYYQNGESKPLILIGHSRGGNVIVSTLLRHPELLENVVARAITVQSPVNGYSSPDNFWMYFISNYGFGFFTEEGNFGLKSLISSGIERALGEKIFKRLSMSDQMRIHNAVLWMTSSKRVRESLIEESLARRFEKKMGLIGDTVVPTRDQHRENYGHLIGFTSKLSHLEAGIVKSNSSEQIYRNRIAALMYALMDIAAHSLKTHNSDFDDISFNVRKKISRAQRTLNRPIRSNPLEFLRSCSTLFK